MPEAGSAPGIVVEAGGGETITALDRREVALLADRPQMSITWSRYGPGEVGPDPHVHHEHTDAWYVLDGELTFILGPEAERRTAGAGTFVAVPPYLIHSFANHGGTDTRFLNFHTPDGGFADFMRGLRDGLDTGFDSFDPPTDGGLAASEAVLRGPDEGEPLVRGNRSLLLKGAFADICFSEFAVDGPLDGPGVHDHNVEVDAFYVLDGELELTVEDEARTALTGTLVAVPPGVRHTFAHRGSGIVRFLNVHAPDGGFAAYLREVSS